jgi:hypothetical protein
MHIQPQVLPPSAALAEVHGLEVLFQKKKAGSGSSNCCSFCLQRTCSKSSQHIQKAPSLAFG